MTPEREQELRQQIVDAIGPNMRLGLQDAELYDEPGAQRISEWVSWIAGAVLPIVRAAVAADGASALNEDAGDRARTLEAEVAAARRFAAEMRDFCSPHGVATMYADQLTKAMDQAKENHR